MSNLNGRIQTDQSANDQEWSSSIIAYSRNINARSEASDSRDEQASIHTHDNISLLSAEDRHGTIQSLPSTGGRTEPEQEQLRSAHIQQQQKQTVYERIESFPCAGATSTEKVEPRKRDWIRKARSRYSQLLKRLHNFLTDTWWPEALALGLSACCLLGIAVLLASYHGHEIPDFPSGVTVNAVISTLAVGAKSALIFAVAATMSQSKWCWFHTAPNEQPRCLQDIQILDDAARGPLGSLTSMLIRRTIVSLCSIGAAIMFLALAYDPFVQQVVSYPVKSVNISSKATTMQALAVSFLATVLDTPETTAAYSGTFGITDSFQRAPYCPTGNCTWESFSSMEWCSKCANFTDEALASFSTGCNFTIAELFNANRTGNYTGGNCTIGFAGRAPMKTQLSIIPEGGGIIMHLDWPPIWELNGAAGGPESNYSIYTYMQEGHEFLGITNPLMPLLFSRLRSTKPPTYTIHADPSTPLLLQLLQPVACALSPCLRTHRLSVTNGELESQILNEDYGILSLSSGGGVCWKPETLKDQDIADIPMVDRGPKFENYTETRGYVRLNSSNMARCIEEQSPREWAPNILKPLAGSIDGVFHLNRSVGDGNEVGIARFVSQDDNPILDLLTMTTLRTPSSLLAGIADALTYVNLHPGPPYDVEFTDPPDVISFVPGTVWGQKVFVHVRWAWLSLPVALTFGAIAFLATTAHQTRRQHLPLWKSSSLATLYHGLESDLVDEDRRYETASDMHSVSRGVYVRLGTTDEEGTQGSGRRMLLRS
ncbi:hypothetical protein H2200_001183 [Cladophialophora chaetospira]|uniref:Uncharacterized protein n=1 Tax=Cladophialophora chaetospira TaxID=386627 RepID=A0AA38XKE7_9EURO|nr:hypothetical protein H2200_001183 [Cladophialophora chaetospira]